MRSAHPTPAGELVARRLINVSTDRRAVLELAAIVAQGHPAVGVVLISNGRAVAGEAIELIVGVALGAGAG